jgi:branched-chain amino acid aminotransferase
VEVVIFAWPWGDYLGEGGLERGVRISVSPWVKFSSRMMPTTAKACGQYLNSILAVREAAGRGFDEALLLDEKGNLAEGSGENIFLVKDGRLFTNDEQSSILLGITRDAVLKIAEDLGLSTEIGVLTLDQLKSADEAFFTGTAVEVTPIRELDGLVIGSGKRGPITERIQQRFFEITSGKRRSGEDWLHSIKNGERGKGEGGKEEAFKVEM